MVAEVYDGGPHGFLCNADSLVHFTDLKEHWQLAVIAYSNSRLAIKPCD